METNVINVARDFSRYPAGRFISDGPYSGEEFRKRLLLPRFQATAQKLIIELDGARGYGSSFLEEAFGGLIRVEGLRAQDVFDRIEFNSSDKSLIEEITGYIRDQSKVSSSS